MREIMGLWGLRLKEDTKVAVFSVEDETSESTPTATATAEAKAQEAAATDSTSQASQALKRVIQLMTSCGLVCGAKGEATAPATTSASIKEALASDWEMWMLFLLLTVAVVAVWECMKGSAKQMVELKAMSIKAKDKEEHREILALLARARTAQEEDRLRSLASRHFPEQLPTTTTPRASTSPPTPRKPQVQDAEVQTLPAFEKQILRVTQVPYD